MIESCSSGEVRGEAITILVGLRERARKVSRTFATSSTGAKIAS